MGVPILTRLLLSMVIVTVLILGEIIYKKVEWKTISKHQLINTINAASISLLTLMSAIIFTDELTVKKMIGIVGVTAGLVLLFL